MKRQAEVAGHLGDRIPTCNCSARRRHLEPAPHICDERAESIPRLDDELEPRASVFILVEMRRLDAIGDGIGAIRRHQKRDRAAIRVLLMAVSHRRWPGDIGRLFQQDGVQFTGRHPPAQSGELRMYFVAPSASSMKMLLC